MVKTGLQGDSFGIFDQGINQGKVVMTCRTSGRTKQGFHCLTKVCQAGLPGEHLYQPVITRFLPGLIRRACLHGQAISIWKDHRVLRGNTQARMRGPDVEFSLALWAHAQKFFVGKTIQHPCQCRKPGKGGGCLIR